MENNKEFLYIGYYKSTENQIILKIGTTDNLTRRAYEHNYNYRRAKQYTMPKENSFHYIWTKPLSKYNTIRFEDLNRELWKNADIGTFIRNDRFLLERLPKVIEIKIRKVYTIPLNF